MKFIGPRTVYAWGRRQVGFHHCATCGCVMGWLPLGEFGHCAVNARVLDGFDPDAVTRFVEEDASVKGGEVQEIPPERK